MTYNYVLLILQVNAKRTFSTASSDALRKVGRTASTEDSGSSEFARVLADLTKYQEIISAILPSKDSSEDNKREEGPVEISVVAEVNDDLDKDTLRDSIEQLVSTCIVIDSRVTGIGNSIRASYWYHKRVITPFRGHFNKVKL